MGGLERKIGSISVSGQTPTYPSSNPKLTLTCYWVRGGVGGQLPRDWYWSEKYVWSYDMQI